MSDREPKTVHVQAAAQGHGVAKVELTVNRVVDHSGLIGSVALAGAIIASIASDLGANVPSTISNALWMLAGTFLAATLLKWSRWTVRGK